MTKVCDDDNDTRRLTKQLFRLIGAIWYYFYYRQVTRQSCILFEYEQLLGKDLEVNCDIWEKRTSSKEI